MKRFLILISVALFAFVACTNNDDFGGNNGNNDNNGNDDGGVTEEVKVESSIDGITLTMTVYEGATSDEISTTISNALEAGCTTLDITLPANAGVDMFKAITAPIAATVDPSLDFYDILWNWNVIQNKIDLTICGAETIPEYMFLFNDYDNENWKASVVLNSVTLTDATTIGESAFFCCANMTSFSAPKATTIAMGAFEGCYSLTEVNLPSAQNIGAMAFSECTTLKEISLPECTSIGNSAFNACSAVETIYLPKVTTIGSSAFGGTHYKLKTITLGAVTSVNHSDSGVFWEFSDSAIKNIDLVLSSEQKVMTFDSGTKYWTATDEAFNFGNTNEFIGYTFKSITAQQ